jgi:hypothetical protein
MSALQVIVNATDIARFERAYQRAPDVVDRTVARRMAGLMEDLASDVQDKTPTAFGTLRASIGTDVEVRPGLGVTGVVGTSLAHAVLVEVGTRPHMPPVAPIKLWAEKKLGLTGREATRAAWAIAMTIKRRGTLGVGMFNRSFAARRREAAELLNYAVMEGLQQALGDKS